MANDPNLVDNPNDGDVPPSGPEHGFTAFLSHASRSHRSNRDRGRSSWHGTAFVLEAVVLLLFITVSMTVIASLLGKAHIMEEDADDLLVAMQLATTDARNGAETFAADPTESVDGLVYYDLVGSSLVERPTYTAGLYTVVRTVEQEPSAGGVIYRAHITVSRYGESVYQLDTCVYESDGRE